MTDAMPPDKHCASLLDDITSAPRSALVRLLDFVHNERQIASSTTRTNPMDFLNGGSTLKDEGAIKEMTLPKFWKPGGDNVSQVQSSVLKQFHFKDEDSSTLSLYYRGKPIPEDAGKTLVDMLSTKAAKADWKLTEDEIRQVSKAMGTVVGDNQYTNSNPPGSPMSPLFKLDDARVRTIDGRAVLEVRGQLVDANGNPTRNFDGVYIPVNSSGTEIQEVMLQSKADRDFSPLQVQFDASLRSIKLK